MLASHAISRHASGAQTGVPGSRDTDAIDGRWTEGSVSAGYTDPDALGSVDNEVANVELQTGACMEETSRAEVN